MVSVRALSPGLDVSQTESNGRIANERVNGLTMRKVVRKTKRNNESPLNVESSPKPLSEFCLNTFIVCHVLTTSIGALPGAMLIYALSGTSSICVHFLVHHQFVCTFWCIINLCALSGSSSICVHLLVHHQFVCTFWYVINLCALSGMSSIYVHFLVHHQFVCTFWYIINLSGTSSICVHLLVHHQFVCTFWYIINFCAPSALCNCDRKLEISTAPTKAKLR